MFLNFANKRQNNSEQDCLRVSVCSLPVLLGGPSSLANATPDDNNDDVIQGRVVRPRQDNDASAGRTENQSPVAELETGDQ